MAAGWMAARPGFLSSWKLKSADTITGLKGGDTIRYEIVTADGKSVSGEVAVSDNQEKITLANIKNTELENYSHYTLSYTIEDEARNSSDVSFYVNRRTGHVRVSADGLEPAALASMNLSGTDKKMVPADWSGRVEFNAAALEDNNSICLDVGGYRGGTLSVCHETAGFVIPVQATASSSLIGKIRNNWIRAMMAMTEQFTAVMMQQVQIVGTMFDAKHQLETQRIFQQAQARAHKDYYPSKQMCEIGTFMRSLAQSKIHSELVRTALDAQMQKRELATGEATTAEGNYSDTLSRLVLYRDYHCNPRDNSNGLGYLCGKGGAAGEQNLDIDYGRLVDSQLTINVNPFDNEITADERAVKGLLDNLIMHTPFPIVPEASTTRSNFVELQLNRRRYQAWRSIARSSLARVIAMKAAGSGNGAGPYMKSLMRELGMSDEQIQAKLGDNPSYQAQLEFLGKIMYSPTFISALYSNSPANLERLETALRGIQSIQDWEINESLQYRQLLSAGIAANINYDNYQTAAKLVREAE